MENVLEVKNIEKYYGNKSNLTKAIDNISFNVKNGEFVGIMGASGSGKTTLLNCVSTIDRVTAGHIIINGEDITKLKGNKLNKFRREELGFIFQDFNLLDNFNNKDNIFLPLVLSKKSVSEMERRLAPIAKQLGIEDILTKYPYEISGGQKQRVAVARALITQPDLVLADEPTGNLDSHTSEEVMELMQQVVRQQKKTLVMVTHDNHLATYADRVFHISDGKIIKIENHRKNEGNKEEKKDE